MQTVPQEIYIGDDGPPPVNRPSTAAAFQATPRVPKRAHILAVIDKLSRAEPIAHNAVAIARSLGLEVTLARVVEHGLNSATLVDPIAWQCDLERQRAMLDAVAKGIPGSTTASGIVLVGDPPDELIDWAEANGATLLALATGTAADPYAMDATALRVLQSGATSLLLVPPQAVASAFRYRRILVPIDGSTRAESVLPIAQRIARAHGAELLLAHVVPEAGRFHGFQTHRLDSLKAEFDRQNQRSAGTNLEQLRARIEGDGIDVQVRLLGPADPRHAICRFACDLSVDLVVMSSHGATALNDVPCGSVAEYLATHCSMPVLLVRPNLVTDFGAGSFDTNGQSVFRFD